MRVILLTWDNRHYVLKWPAHTTVAGDEMLGQLATGGEVRIPVSNYAAQEEYGDHQIESFRVRLRQVEEAEAARSDLVEHYERQERIARESTP